MAKIEVISEPSYRLELTAAEATGLRNLLGQGVRNGTLQILGLMPVLCVLEDAGVPSTTQSFREWANLTSNN